MRTSRRSLLLLVAAAASLGVAGRAEAEKIHENAALNYYLVLPDGRASPNGVSDTWGWQEPAPWAAQGVVEVGERRLTELKNKAIAPTGQGVRAMLSVQDVPATLDPEFETWLRDWQILEDQARAFQNNVGGNLPEELDAKIRAALAKVDQALVAFAGRPEVQSLLTKRFEKAATPAPAVTDPKGPKKDAKAAKDEKNAKPAVVLPAVVVEGDQWIERVMPAARVSVESTSPNLDGVDAPCVGRMFVWVIRKKVYRLVFWVWPTEYDYEGLKNDIDEIELAFMIPNKTAIPRKPDKAPPGGKDPVAGGPAAKPVGDSAEEFMIPELALGFRVTKPKGLSSTKIDRAANAAMKDTGFEFRSQSGSADLLIDLLSYKTFEIDPYLAKLWIDFLKLHPAGVLETIPFPTYTDKEGFLVLPEGKPQELKRPADKEKDKPSKNDLVKLGVVEEVKGARIGKVKLKEAWRFCMKGVAQRAGEDIQLQYVFQSDERVYILRIYARGGAYGTQKAVIEAVLKSFTLIEAPK